MQNKNVNEPQNQQSYQTDVSGSCFGRISEKVFNELKSLDDLIEKM